MANSTPPSGGGSFFDTLVQEHAQIEERLKALDEAALTVSRDAGARGALDAIAATLAFFATDGERHQADEELTLFPRLRPLRDFQQILVAMDFQHKMNDATGRELAACVERFTPERSRELQRLAVRFAEMHRGHMIAEERAMFPLAVSRLSPDVLAEMNREMQQRRATPTRTTSHNG